VLLTGAAAAEAGFYVNFRAEVAMTLISLHTGLIVRWRAR
jgi:hypothetical protein